jgi:hypothetical protein
MPGSLALPSPRSQKWEEWPNLVMGAWLVVAPWVLGFSGVASAKWNAAHLSGNELFRGAGFSLPSYTQR